MLVRSRKERGMRGGAAPSALPFKRAPREFMRSWELLRLLMRALRPAPRVTFLRKESHQRFARDLLVPGPPAQGGGPPWIPPPPALAVLVAIAQTLKHPRKHPLPRHGLTAGSVTPGVAWGEKKTDLPTYSKWQIGLGRRQKVARRETERSAASAKRAVTPHWGIPKGGSPWRAFGDFPRDGKVTRGRRGGAPSPRGRGGPSPHFGERRGGHRRCGPSQKRG